MIKMNLTIWTFYIILNGQLKQVDFAPTFSDLTSCQSALVRMVKSNVLSIDIEGAYMCWPVKQ